MDPERRREAHIDPQREADGQRADDEDASDRRPIPRIMGAQVEPAGVAGLADVEQAAKQRALAAARAAASRATFQTGAAAKGGIIRPT